MLQPPRSRQEGHEVKERVKALEMQVGQLQIQMQQLSQHLAAEQQQTRDLLEKLAAVSGLEYSNDAKAWASKQKLTALREKPRDDPL